jgi:hypothetical protein
VLCVDGCFDVSVVVSLVGTVMRKKKEGKEYGKSG